LPAWANTCTISEVRGTLDALDDAIESLDIGLDRDELSQAQRALDHLSAKLVAAYGAFDAADSGTSTPPPR
jgi:hypothetical protein